MITYLIAALISIVVSLALGAGALIVIAISAIRICDIVTEVDEQHKKVEKCKTHCG